MLYCNYRLRKNRIVMDTKSVLIKKHFFNITKEILKTKKLEDITVNDICSFASFSRTTFYRYFKDKNDLMSELYNELIKSKIFTEELKHNFYQQTLISLTLSKDNLKLLQKLITYQGQNSFLEYFSKSIQDYFIEAFTYYYGEKPNREQLYMITFNTFGIVSIFKCWITHSCKESPKEITNIIIKSLSEDIKKVILNPEKDD